MGFVNVGPTRQSRQKSGQQVADQVNELEELALMNWLQSMRATQGFQAPATVRDGSVGGGTRKTDRRSTDAFASAAINRTT